MFVVVLDHNFEVSKPSALQHRPFHYQLGAPKRCKLTAVVKMFTSNQRVIAVLISQYSCEEHAIPGLQLSLTEQLFDLNNFYDFFIR